MQKLKQKIMVPAVAAALISGGAAMSQTVFNGAAQNKWNKNNYKHDFETANYAWNNYNSPIAQKRSLIEAGFNPALAVGEPSSQAVATSQGQAAQSNIDFGALASSYLQYKIQKEQLDIQDRQAQADIDLKRAQQNDAQASADLKQKDILSYDDRNTANLQLLADQHEQIRQQIDIVVPETVENMRSARQLTYKQIDKLAKEISILHTEGTMLSREERLQAKIMTEEFLSAYAENQLQSVQLEKVAMDLQKIIIEGSSTTYEKNNQWMEKVKNDIMTGEGNPSDICRYIALAFMSQPLDVVRILGSAVGKYVDTGFNLARTVGNHKSK